MSHCYIHSSLSREQSGLGSNPTSFFSESANLPCSLIVVLSKYYIIIIVNTSSTNVILDTLP